MSKYRNESRVIPRFAFVKGHCVKNKEVKK